MTIFEPTLHFRHLVDGWNLAIFTDHKAFTYGFHSTLTELIDREIGYMSQFTSELRLVYSLVAEALSG